MYIVGEVSFNNDLQHLHSIHVPVGLINQKKILADESWHISASNQC